MKVLTGRQTLGLTIDPQAQTFKKGARIGEQYYRARHDGKGFIVTPEFKQAFDNGDLYEVTLTEGSYEAPDPLNADALRTIESWTVSGFGTKKQVKSFVEFDYELKMVELKGVADNAKEVEAIQHKLEGAM